MVQLTLYHMKHPNMNEATVCFIQRWLIGGSWAAHGPCPYFPDR